jgi:hypothetical protein
MGNIQVCATNEPVTPRAYRGWKKNESARSRYHEGAALKDLQTETCLADRKE